MKKKLFWLFTIAITFLLAACGNTSALQSARSEAQNDEDETTLTYGSGDYTRINPAMDEHGEINILIFNGLTAHNGDNEVIPSLARSWEVDEFSCTYTFHLEEGVKWHDGEPFTADDVRFTIEAIMNPENGSENGPNYEDVEEITVLDDFTIAFKLTAPNVAFLDYMTMAVLPEHLLSGEDMQESSFFRNPVGTGPYKLESWDVGQAITLVKNEDYFKGVPNIDRIIFKIVPDDHAKAVQMESGELDLALLTHSSYTNEQGFVHRQAVSDNNVITANGTAALEFAQEVLRALAVATEEQIKGWYDFHKLGFYNAPMPKM